MTTDEHLCLAALFEIKATGFPESAPNRIIEAMIHRGFINWEFDNNPAEITPLGLDFLNYLKIKEKQCPS